VLRYRPEPYYGTHVLLQVDDAQAGRAFLRDLTPHVASAADWWQAAEPWIAVGLTYAGLAALGVAGDSLESFPEAFRVGMAARADELRDHGANHPSRWEPPFGTGVIHLGVSVFSGSQESWRAAMDTARRHYVGRPGLRVLTAQDFGAQPGDLNPLGYRDSIGQPAMEGSGVEPLPGQGPAIKAGEFILGYPGEAGVPLTAPRPDVLGRNGTYVGLRKYQSRVGAFNRFLYAVKLGDPNIFFSNGGVIDFPDSNPFQTTTGTIDVAMFGATGIQDFYIDIAGADPGIAKPIPVSHLDVRGNANDVASSSASDNVEARVSAWSTAGSTNGTWVRQQLTPGQPSPFNYAWHSPDQGSV